MLITTRHGHAEKRFGPYHVVALNFNAPGLL
jgi:hypothetical protein